MLRRFCHCSRLQALQASSWLYGDSKGVKNGGIRLNDAWRLNLAPNTTVRHTLTRRRSNLHAAGPEGSKEHIGYYKENTLLILGLKKDGLIKHFGRTNSPLHLDADATRAWDHGEFFDYLRIPHES